MIVLASASRTRAEMLVKAGVDFRISVPPIDEAAIKLGQLAAGQGPQQIAETLAEAKALTTLAADTELVIGADQTLELDGALIDKAGNVAEAAGTLRRLRGKSHQLHSAAVLARSGEVVWRAKTTSRLVMRNFSDAFLDRYLERCGAEACSAVGGYQLEALGAQLFEHVEGDLFSIMGLPLLALLDGLRCCGGLPR